MHVITDSFSASTVVAPLAEYLVGKGWHNVIVCSDRSYADAHPFAERMRAQGLDVRTVDIPRTIKPFADARRIAEVWDLIRHEKPSIVHTHLAKAGVIGRIAAWLAGRPCVHMVYDYAFVEHSGLRRGAYRMIECVTAPLARRILFISESERQISLSERVGHPSQLVTVGLGVDLRMFNPGNVFEVQVTRIKRSLGIPEQRLVVGAVARLLPRKGIDLLLKAAAMLPTSLLDWHLLIAGGGPLQRQMVDLARQLGIDHRVSFAGFIDDPYLIPAVLATMDVFCLPSRREGYGMAYAEAGAMGKPVVAPDISPVNAIVVHGKTGLLSQPEDPMSIADALETLLHDRGLRTSMGKEARAFVTGQCDMRQAFARIEAVYREQLAPGSGEPSAEREQTSSNSR